MVDHPEPQVEAPDEVKVRIIRVGICGTDRELAAGDYGWPPPKEERLIIGHESLGVVTEAPEGCGFSEGDLVVGVVRRPDPEPCENCASGEWDMCRNGRYTERGIKGRDGYLSERFRIEPEFCIRADARLGRLAVLTEPSSVVAKAWEHVERIGSRAVFRPRTALVLGAGPLGLLAALLGVQRGLEMHVVDVVREGPKPDLVRDLGATYHTGSIDDIDLRFDVAIDCTGVGPLVLHAIERLAPDGVMCLTGISPAGRTAPTLDVDALNKQIVLGNNAVFGSVNAGLRHYEQGAAALARADHGWLDRMVTRWEPLDRWEAALERRDGDVKTVVEVSGA
jgi:threonine dehydrogenase-like Zn-dependent dehydrogenase